METAAERPVASDNSGQGESYETWPDFPSGGTKALPVSNTQGNDAFVPKPRRSCSQPFSAQQLFKAGEPAGSPASHATQMPELPRPECAPGRMLLPGGMFGPPE